MRQLPNVGISGHSAPLSISMVSPVAVVFRLRDRGAVEPHGWRGMSPASPPSAVTAGRDALLVVAQNGWWTRYFTLRLGPSARARSLGARCGSRPVDSHDVGTQPALQAPPALRGPSYSTCAAANYNAPSREWKDLPSGTTLCIKTSDTRVGRVQFVWKKGKEDPAADVRVIGVIWEPTQE